MNDLEAQVREATRCYHCGGKGWQRQYPASALEEVAPEHRKRCGHCLEGYVLTVAAVARALEAGKQDAAYWRSMWLASASNSAVQYAWDKRNPLDTEGKMLAALREGP